MLPLARAFDAARILFVTLLPTIALSFCFNALVGAASPREVEQADADDNLPAITFHVEEPAVADAAVEAAAKVAIDNPDVDADVFDRAEQCCHGPAVRMWRSHLWHWMIP